MSWWVCEGECGHSGAHKCFWTNRGQCVFIQWDLSFVSFCCGVKAQCRRIIYLDSTVIMVHIGPEAQLNNTFSVSTHVDDPVYSIVQQTCCPLSLTWQSQNMVDILLNLCVWSTACSRWQLPDPPTSRLIESHRVCVTVCPVWDWCFGQQQTSLCKQTLHSLNVESVAKVGRSWYRKSPGFWLLSFVVRVINGGLLTVGV